jgi:hypothetical protein
MPPKNTTKATANSATYPSTTTTTTNYVSAGNTTTEEEDNATTTEDETTQDSDYEVPATEFITSGQPLLPIQEVQQEEESDEESESDESSENEPEDAAESETEIPFMRAGLLDSIATSASPLIPFRIAEGTYLYLLTGPALTKFTRLVKYHTYGNQLATEVATRMAIDIARSQQVVAPLSAVNTQDGELFVIDDVYTLMALRNLSDGVIEKLTVMLMVYEFRALADPGAKALFTRLNSRQQLTIETQTVSDIDHFMALILAQPAFKEGIKTSAANRKANFPHISAAELRKSFQEVISRLRENGAKPDIGALANRLIDFNCICKGKPISTLFGLHVGAASTHAGESIDDKTRERYKKMVAKDFYLASAYGRCWPQFLLGRADTELVAAPKGSSAPVIPTVSQKFSFTLKKS